MATNGFHSWQQQDWEGGESDIAIKMQLDGHNFQQIARALGRTPGAVRGFFRRLERKTGKKVTWSAAVRSAWNSENGRRVSDNVVRVFRAPQEVIDYRDARYLEPRTVTMELLGDPVPSRSALKRFCP